MRTRVAAVALSLAAAACGAESEPRTLAPEVAERGRAERAFWARYDVARAALADGDEVRAGIAFRKALDSKPNHVGSLYALAGIERRAGRQHAALALAKRLEGVDLPKTRALLLQATIQSDVEAYLVTRGTPATAQPTWYDVAAAAEAAREAETINPEETGPHFMRARIALLEDRPKDALASLARLLTIHPDDAEALVLRALAHERSGDRKRALESVHAALRVTAPRSDAPEPPAIPGEGDTAESLKRRSGPSVARLRALACLLRLGGDWPDEAPAPPPEIAVPTGGDDVVGFVVRADFDGDGATDELSLRRAPEESALRALFGLRREPGWCQLTLGGRDATEASGLEGFAACVASLAVVDADDDGRPDVLVLPGAGEPSRCEPRLVLRNLGNGRFEVRRCRE